MISAALTDWRWSNGLVDDLPARYERSIISRYTSKYKTDEVGANVWLRRVMQKIHRIKMPLLAISSDDCAASWASEYYRLRYTTARNSHATIDELIPRYEHLRDYARKVGFVAPGEGRKKMTLAQVSQCVAHLDNEKWWQRKAKITAAQAREYMAIALGLVGRGAESYVSKECLSEWRQQQRNAAEFLESNFIGAESESDSGFDDMEICSLADASKSTTANPEIRRLEMMARIRGMKEAAEAEGRTAVFVTITAPGAYHANAGKKWSGASPVDTQRYLSNQWKKCRAELNDHDIKISGLRVVEPHNDETPHWHMLLFVAVSQKAALIDIMQRYALQHDADEKGAAEHRFTVEEIDPAKGCAVAYIAKYISKSINGAHNENEPDNETGEPLSDVSEKCRAFASRWRIRQFQFIGAPPVSVWRELRRIREGISTEVAQLSRVDLIHHAADRGSFRAFIQLMGGLNAARGSYPVDTVKRISETASGTVREKIVGIIEGAHNYMITRRNWIQLGNIKPSLSRFCLWQGASRAARTRVNNCKLDPEAVNDKLAAATRNRPAIVGYIDAVGRWVVEKVTDYFNKGNDYEFA